MTVIKPYITEKSMAKTADNVYTFLVDKKENKKTIAELVRKNFKVDPLRVTTVVRKGKLKRYKQRPGKRADKKIAFVKLPAKQSIKEFALEKNVKEENDKEKDKGQKK